MQRAVYSTTHKCMGYMEPNSRYIFCKSHSIDHGKGDRHATNQSGKAVEPKGEALRMIDRTYNPKHINVNPQMMVAAC